jgi:hypothetical protein
MRLTHEGAGYIITKDGEDVTDRFEGMHHFPCRDWVVLGIEIEIDKALEIGAGDPDWDILELDGLVESFLDFDHADDADAWGGPYPHLDEVEFFRGARAEITWAERAQKEDIMSATTDYGTIAYEGMTLTLTEQAELSDRVFPGGWDDAEEGEEYFAEYSAPAVDGQGEKYTVYWRFRQIKGEEGPEDDLPWDNDPYAVERRN